MNLLFGYLITGSELALTCLQPWLRLSFTMLIWLVLHRQTQHSGQLDE